MYYCCGITSQGVMPHNEDAFLIHKTVITDGALEAKLSPPFLLGVSDGVSGEVSGEVASRKCLDLISGIRFSRKTNMQRKLEDVHSLLAQYGAGSSDTRNMQATFCGIGVDENDLLHFYNVGDSRLYRYRNARMKEGPNELVVLLDIADDTFGEMDRLETYKSINRTLGRWQEKYEGFLNEQGQSFTQSM